jgi:hypothetical protein
MHLTELLIIYYSNYRDVNTFDIFLTNFYYVNKIYLDSDHHENS